MRRRIAAALVAGLLAAPAAHAASVRAEARALPAKATVGDEIRLVVRVERPKSVVIEPPAPGNALAPFEVKRVDVAPFLTGKNRVVETVTLTLTVFETGKLTVPPVEIRYRDASGKPGSVKTSPVDVNIESVAKNLSEKDDIKPIKPPVPAGLDRARRAAMAAGAALLTALLVFLVCRRLARRPKVDPESLKSPDERALLELGRVKAKGEADPKAFYGELSDVLRRYLDRRFELGAAEFTTAETLARMKEKAFPAPVIADVKTVLEEADLVKFANQAPRPGAAARCEEALKKAVEATKPEPEKKGERRP